MVQQRQAILRTTPIHKAEVTRVLDGVQALHKVHSVLCGRYNAFGVERVSEQLL